MTNRELFHATMNRENGDELLQFELNFNVPYKKWYEDGLPKYVVPTKDGNAEITEYENLFDHFNVTGMLFCPRINQYCIPRYEEKILSDDGRVKIYINESGNTVKEISDNYKTQNNDGSSLGSPPLEIDFAIKKPRDYEENRFRFIGNIEERIDNNALENADAFINQNDYISMFMIHGPYAYLREIIGTEEAMVMPYTEPAMIKMMLQDHLETSKLASEKIIKEYQPDVAFVWEDCCGSTGPFISPTVFDEVFLWWYKEWKDFTLSLGIQWTMLDTDGDPTPLVTRWYENGIDCIHPWEVNSVDMLKIAEEHPEYILQGGIYKHIFEPGDISQVGRFDSTNVYEAIDKELERVIPYMQNRGGYLPSLDHGAYWAVSYDAYRYYCEKLYDYGKSNKVTRAFKIK